MHASITAQYTMPAAIGDTSPVATATMASSQSCIPRRVSRNASAASPLHEQAEREDIPVPEPTADPGDVDGQRLGRRRVAAAQRLEELGNQEVPAGRALRPCLRRPTARRAPASRWPGRCRLEATDPSRARTRTAPPCRDRRGGRTRDAPDPTPDCSRRRGRRDTPRSRGVRDHRHSRCSAAASSR